MDGKLQPELMAIYPLAKLAEVYTIGAGKHGPRSWEEGLPWSAHVGALMRHLFRWLMGQRIDPEDGQHHLASVMWRAAALMQYELTCPEKNDLKVDPRVAEATLRIFDSPKDPEKVCEELTSVGRLYEVSEEDLHGYIRSAKTAVEIAKDIGLENDAYPHRPISWR